MAHLLRKVAVIGFIAMNSPLLAGKPDEPEISAAVSKAASALQTQAHGGASSLSAAREAAQILAGLDPELRNRLVGAAAGAMAKPVQR